MDAESHRECKAARRARAPLPVGMASFLFLRLLRLQDQNPLSLQG